MEENIPKKRGRKKKVVVPDPIAIKEDVSEVEQHIESEKQSEKKPPLSSEEKDKLKRKRLAKIIKLQESTKIFNYKVDSTAFYSRIKAKFMERRYKNYMWRIEGYDLQYCRLYNDILNDTYIESDYVNWNKTVTSNAVRKIAEIIEYFLMCGPLTESESQLLNRCVSLFKAYFYDRYFLCIRNPRYAAYYQRDSYVPEPNSILNDLFVNDTPSSLVTYVYSKDSDE